MGRSGRAERVTAWTGLLVLAFLPGLASAQTPVTSLGLGYPVIPIDGRAAALGGTGMGFIGGSFSSRNPADLTLFAAPGVGATLGPESADVKHSGGKQSTSRSRFVVAQAVLPVRSWAFGFHINAETDLDWDVVVRDTLDSTFGRYPYREQQQHDGAISSVGVGAAYRFGSVALGLESSVLTGNLRQVFRRDFDPAIDDPTNQIAGVLGESRWAFNGWRFRGGATVDLGSRATLSAAVTTYGRLSAKKDTLGNLVEARDFDMPVEVAAGGTVRLGERLMLALAGGWRGWSATDFSVLDFEADDVVWAGGGLEYVGARLGRIPLPLRAGYRYTDLPFHAGGLSQLSERAFTFGIGAWIGGGRATIDIGFETGSRGDLASAGSEENFRRVSLSLGIVGP